MSRSLFYFKMYPARAFTGSAPRALAHVRCFRVHGHSTPSFATWETRAERDDEDADANEQAFAELQDFHPRTSAALGFHAL